MKNLSAIEKYRVIAPLLDREMTAVEVSAGSGVPCRTIRRWVKEFAAHGLEGLRRKKRSDTAKRRKLKEELLELTQALALQKPPLTIAAIHRKVATIAQKKSCKPPAYATVYGAVKSISPALLTLAHEGGKAYGQKYELIYRRECSRSNEVWQADHTQLDIYILDGKGKERRPWLTIVLDDYSRAVSGYYLSLEAPSALHTALALRQAIWRKEEPLWQVCGVPLILYTDHGSDFTSLHIAQVCARLKIRTVNSAVGRPQGRGKIERFFETINERVLTGLPGYTLQGKATSRPILDLSALQRVLEKFILEEYHYRQHGATGQAPVERWAEGFLPQLPASLEELDMLLLYVDRPRQVQRDGIRFQGLRYIAPTLAGFVGEAVTVRYDPRDLAEIRVYHREQFLCRAICQDIAQLQVSLKEIQKARRGIKKGLYQEVRKARQLIKNIEKERQSKLPPQTAKESKPTSERTISLKRYENE